MLNQGTSADNTASLPIAEGRSLGSGAAAAQGYQQTQNASCEAPGSHMK